MVFSRALVPPRQCLAQRLRRSSGNAALMKQCQFSLRWKSPNDNHIHLLDKSYMSSLLTANFSSSSSSSGHGTPSSMTNPTKNNETEAKSTPFTNDNSNSNNYREELWTPVYVHPLSNMVLLYLQQNFGDWIASKSLQRLQIHRDGTFVLSSKSASSASSSSTTATTATTTPSNIHNSSMIWTCYDEMDRKSWLYYCSAKQKYVQPYPFLLKDYNMPTVCQRHNQEEQVRLAVREMILIADKVEDDEITDRS